MTRSVRPAHIAIAEMLAALLQRPQTSHDLCERSGLAITTMRGYLRQMRRRRVVHVAAWVVRGSRGKRQAAYSLGSGTDAPKPPPTDRATIVMRYRARRADRIEHRRDSQ